MPCSFHSWPKCLFCLRRELRPRLLHLAKANATIFVSPELVIQLETDLHNPSMVQAQPVLIYTTDPSGRGPNVSRDERNVGHQK